MEKRNWIFALLVILVAAAPCFAAPGAPGGRPGGMHSSGARVPMHASVHVNRPPMSPRMPMRPVSHPPMHHVAARPLPPPIYRPYRPIIRPYYYSPIYYPAAYYSTSYTYYPYSNYIYEGVEPVPAAVNTVVVRDDYAGINTAANVLNTAANVAATVRYLTW